MQPYGFLATVLLLGLMTAASGCGPGEEDFSAEIAELREINSRLQERIREQDETIELLAKSSWRYEILVDSAEHLTLLSDSVSYRRTSGAGTTADVPVAFIFRGPAWRDPGGV